MCKKIKKYLPETHPHLIEEWDKDRNKLKPEEVTCGSQNKVFWVCGRCRHSWAATVVNRTLGTGCPACAGKVVTSTNNLKCVFPELSKEWDHNKNLGLMPEGVTPKRALKVFWKCSDCDRSWRSRIYNRSNGRGCPYCAKSNFSLVSQKWLDGLGINIREHYIKSLGVRVDGFDPETNTVYEFLGDFWHGNPEMFKANKMNPINKKTYGQLYKDTFKRINQIKSAGYKVVYIWEKDYLGNKEKMRHDQD